MNWPGFDSADVVDRTLDDATAESFLASLQTSFSTGAPGQGGVPAKRRSITFRSYTSDNAAPRAWSACHRWTSMLATSACKPRRLTRSRLSIQPSELHRDVSAVPAHPSAAGHLPNVGTTPSATAVNPAPGSASPPAPRAARGSARRAGRGRLNARPRRGRACSDRGSRGRGRGCRLARAAGMTSP